MRKNPGRLAWIILLASFFTCIALAVAVPLSVRAYALYAQEEQNVALEVQKGPLRVTMAGRGEPIAIAETRDGIPESTIVATDSTVGRLVMYAAEDGDPVATTVQLYDNTVVGLISARSPLFAVSSLPHQVTLEIPAGRVRIAVSNVGERATVCTVYTPHAVIALTEGSYEVQVNAMTEVAVHHGQAEVRSHGGPTMPLTAAQRAIVRSGQTDGPLPASLNLIANGDFQADITAWDSYTEQDEPPPGTVDVVTNEGQKTVYFRRLGSGHAETGIVQQIDADTRDLSFLQLHLMLRIEEHNIPVCGTAGSECPVMVRINYEDANGAEQEWLQGFYWQPDPNTPGNPSVCITCSTRNPHIRIPENTWYAYLSGNLIPLLSQDGKPPTRIKSITIYASGHTYGSMVTQVELIGQ